MKPLMVVFYFIVGDKKLYLKLKEKFNYEI